MRKMLAMMGLVMFLGTQVASAAFPVDFLFRWTNPTEREDGTALTIDELASYEAYCLKGGTEVFRQSWAREGTTTERFFPAAVDGAGTYDCQMNVTDTEGRTSVWSNVATKKVTGNPNAPVIIEFGAGRS
jgi:hypothetical protein